MVWGLVSSHDLATPFVVARPLEEGTIISTIVHKMSDGDMLTIIRMKVVWRSPTGDGWRAFSNTEQLPDAAWFSGNPSVVPSL
jgi:hypothetical protein